MKSFALVVLLASAVVADESVAATLHVANNGVDSATCGAPADPCRSIGRAIANASPGDTILVGPGAYGDLTGNDDFLTPGEEPGGVACNPGAICVDKALRLESTHGARATVYNGNGSNSVEILADDAVFGGPGKGFTVTGDLNSGVGGFIRVAAGTNRVVVAGNRLLDSTIEVDGTGHTIEENELSGGNNGTIVVQGSGHLIRRNILSSSVMVGSPGIIVFGSDQSLIGNLITGRHPGVELADGVTGITVQGNSILTAGQSGLLLGEAAEATVSGNNIFGRPLQAGNPGSNCGLYNNTGATVDATNNFWGAASGPGPDPADDVCEERPGSATIVVPFATQAFPIQLPGSPGGGANDAPVCTAALAAPSTLWPANGQFSRVWVLGVGDPDDDPVSITVTGVTQDEPVNGPGDQGPDAVLHGSSVDVRAQRAGGGNGRVYRIAFTASDGNGGSCTGAIHVAVPNSQKPGQSAIDDGQVFLSTQP